MTEYCTHIDCRTEAVLTLKFMARTIPSRGEEFLRDAREVINNEALAVRCQHIPRAGRVNAPLPEKGAV